MSACAVCKGFGVIRVGYDDGQPHDYGICLCAAGQELRVAENAGRTVDPRWMLWAAQRGIAVERVGLVEDLLEPEDLAAMPFAPGLVRMEAGPAVAGDIEAQLIAAGRCARKVRL